MSQYLLSCNCGESITVRTQQAGESVRCVCGQLLTVPTLRNLRTLPAVEQIDSESSAASWTPLRGWLFAIGVSTVLISVAIAAYCELQRRKLNLDKPSLAALAVNHRDLSKIKPLDAWNIWKQVEKAPLTRRGTPRYLVHRQRAKVLTRFSIAAAVLGLIGAVAVVVALAGRREPMNEFAAPPESDTSAQG